ncbi:MULTISPECIES: DUF5789 family protein [Salinibaculum]|uniref:DUF5789 family protein n=1 Tax=Salinibaculum TaxID=2732368 RepID=UPI0030CBC1CA
MREIRLNELETVLSGVEFPATREKLVSEWEDVTLVLADGEENLGNVLAESSDDVFESKNDVSTEVMNLLPREAVGEPYQSEGEG